MKVASLIAIPTTSGSGSEATHFAVAYLNGMKYSVADEKLVPEYVISDPELTYSLSSYQSAVSGIDALCQAIESFWAKGANKESREYSKIAIKILLNKLRKVVNEPDPESRAQVMKAANLAGKAINITKTTAPHAMSYGLTTHFGVPHGQAVGLILPYFFKLNLKVSSGSDEDITRRTKVMSELFEVFGANNASHCKSIFMKLLNDLGVDALITDKEVTDLDLNKLVDEVNIERLQNHPKKILKNELFEIYSSILKKQ